MGDVVEEVEETESERVSFWLGSMMIYGVVDEKELVGIIQYLSMLNKQLE